MVRLHFRVSNLLPVLASDPICRAKGCFWLPKNFFVVFQTPQTMEHLMEEVLVVRLMEARDLTPGQTSGLSDPFVKLTFGSTTFKSKTARSLLLL